ncbi:sulfite exporter TauE/SafE family protein [Nodosilinea sp. LEGE 07088]|uniref:nickel/cobalt transporter n=1 Tax=Nodosilinea sp. LEGE 07088 TaxID=2777968 RepID=UPI00187E6185|nr:sulfite exporter TauE/SafE family protein [Nodosilinea sp. LEGE 07088]MBE9141350.1 sulfite exporter TauE/SafE family protein [Nodosilinea sp. LEGE 07088]
MAPFPVLTPTLAHLETANSLTQLLTAQPSPGAIAAGIAIAFGFGAVHALSPGHGKTLVGAYLVGSRGTPGAALWLGIATTVTHTVTVFALGVATLVASQYVVLDQVYPILGALSGVAICLVGLRLLAVRLWSGAHHHHHDHDHHDHDHYHHDHHHHHAPEDWRSLLAIGISGGLVPCPSALVLLLSAIALHQIAYGLVLVGGFSLGLASVLTTLGLAAVYGQQWLENSPFGAGVMHRLSAVSAFGTVCIGIGLTMVSLKAGGLG